MSRFDNYESCRCRGERVIDEIVQISATRRLLRCKGTIGMWDDIQEREERVEKVRPPKREYTMTELAELR